MKIRRLHRLVLATARVCACVQIRPIAVVVVAGLAMVTFDVQRAHAGERPDGAHTGVLIEPLPDAVDSHGGAGSAGGIPGAPALPLRSPQPSHVGPAVIDSWSARDGGVADTKQAPSRQPPTAPGRADSGDAAVRALFETAREALDQGRTDEAQGLFERLVVEAPQSQLAKETRRQLGIIYRSAAETPATATAAAPAVATQSAHTVTSATSASPDRATASNETPPAVAGALAKVDPLAATAVAAPAPWREHARSTQRFEEMLRADVGDRIFFSVGSADLGSRARTVLERQAEWIGKYPDLYVVVEGHADEPGGSSDVNTALALRRAELVRARLIEAGVPASRIDVLSRGASERAVTCDGAICRSQNSRVVTRLMVVLPAMAGNRPTIGSDSADRARFAGSAQDQQAAGELPPRR